MSDVAAALATTTKSPAIKKAKVTKPKGEESKDGLQSPRLRCHDKVRHQGVEKSKRTCKTCYVEVYRAKNIKVGDNEKQLNARLRVGLKRGVQSGLLTQAGGTGAAGRFRLAEKSSHEATTKVPRKPKVKSKAKPKERAAASLNKQVKKEKSSSSPKKAAKPKAKSAKSVQKVAMKKAAAKPKAPKKTKQAAPAKA